MTREDGRSREELRQIKIVPNFTKWAEGSVLCCFGDTHVLCNASIEERVPGWLKEQKRGWVTGEYAMLPRATDERTRRESTKGKIGGRTHEISRLLGRSLRAGVDLKRLGERSITLDCDVLQADGGTRTASITGAWVALAIAVRRLMKKGALTQDPLLHQVAAVSLGVKDGQVLCDLDYREDQNVDTDLNLVLRSDGGIIEVQGTAEGTPFSEGNLAEMVRLGRQATEILNRHQLTALEAALST